MTSLLICVDSAALLMLIVKQFYLLGHIQTNQTGGQPCSDIPPYGRRKGGRGGIES